MASTFTDRINGLSTSVAVKAPVLVATTSNITLNGLQTIDGVVVTSGDRVLVKDQTSSTENGIYAASTSGWTREPDFDGNRDIVHGTLMWDLNSSILYQVTTANPITIGTSNINFSVASSLNVTGTTEVVNKAAMAALAASTLGENQLILVANRTTAGDGGGGVSIVTKTDISANVALDTQEGVYVPFDSDVTGSSGGFIRTKITSINIRWFGAKGDGVADDTVATQAALNFAEANNKPIFAPEGTYKITAQLNYIVTSTDVDTSSGLVLRGAGMGKTVFLNKFSSGALVYVQSTSPFFAKNCQFQDFTILGDTITGAFSSQIGIRMKGVWWSSLENLRIIKLNGVALQVGDDTAENPDTTANLGIFLQSCEFDENVGGILNPVNNNAPFIIITNCGIRNNSQFGIIGNSSYIEVRGGSIAFNGILDQANAKGGIIFEEKTGTTFSIGYRSKGLLIEGVELDTNYPFNVDVTRGDALEIRHCSIQFRDYSTIDWAAAGITTWPLSQIRIGGSVNNDQAWNVKFHHNRVSIKSDGVLTFNAAGHSIVHVLPYGFGFHYEDQMHNLELGAGVMGADFFILKEDDKAGTGHTDRKFYSVVDYPSGNVPAVDILAGFKTFTPQVLPSFESFHGRNQHFAFNLADDAVKIIVVPTISSEVGVGFDYGQASIVANGISTMSALVTYRATTNPECSVLATAAGTLVETTTGVLTGITGTDTKLTISVDASGNLYVENRTGSSKRIFVSFSMAPGIIDQI